MNYPLLLTAFTGSTLALQQTVIPSWHLQSTEVTGNDLAKISQHGYDASSWYKISARKTVFAGLIEAGVYNEDQLFYSQNLQDTVDYLPYYSPWLYRAEVPLHPSNGKHYFLQTNGITSKADIYLNGQEVADKTVQAGSYGGHTYEITSLVGDSNALLIRA